MLKNNKCPNCAGYFVYSPKDNALKCQSCGSTKPVDCTDDISQHDYESTKLQYNNDWTKDAKTIKCQNCGANIVISRFSMIDKCSYCGNSALVDVNNINSIKPDAVLPFSIDVEQAKTFFKEGLKGKMFIPNVLKRETPKLNITPRYVNAYVFNASLIAKYSATLVFEETEYDSKGNRHTSSYTKHVAGEMPHKVVDYVVESNSNLSQSELEKIMPYNLSNLKSYSGEFLFGATAEYSNKSLIDANRELEDELHEDIRRSIIHKYHADGANNVSIELNYISKKYCYCLLPTYSFDYDFNKKHYSTIMNGTTGKLGGGVPRSGAKITLFVLAILFSILGIGLLLYFWL